LVWLLTFVFIGGVSAAVSITASVSPNPIYQGQTTTATATVSASGTAASNVTVTIGYPAGVSIVGSASQVIASIPAGSSKSVSWTVKGEQASSTPYTLTFTATGASSSASVQLSVLTPPFIEVSNQSCSPTDINVQQTVTISFILKNTGGDATNAQVDMDYNSDCFSIVTGQDPWSQDINAGGQVALSYDFNAIDAGTETITARISSAYNDPNDYSCTITVNAVCGDGYCSNGETCSTCSTDCGSCPTTPTPTPSPTPTPTLVPVTGGGAGTTTTTTPTPSPTPSPTPTPSPMPGEKVKKVEKLFEKVITERTLGPDIKEALSKIGASDVAIKKAIRALTKVRISRQVSVEKLVDEEGKVSFKTTVSFELKNTAGEKLIDLKVIEVIPKTVLEHIDENMIESELAFEIVEADPILRFTVPELDVNKTLTVSYVIKSDINKDAAEEWKAPFVAIFKEAPVDLCKDVVCEPKLCKKVSCDPATGECVYENLPDGTACGDNKECKAGECVEIVVEKEKAEFPWHLVILVIIIAIIAAGAVFYKYKKQEKGKTPLEKAVTKAHKEAESKFKLPLKP
jgi:hypothetical protein